MTDHVATKHKLRDAPLKADLADLFERCNLSDTERRLLELYYLGHKDMRYIADDLGCTEKTAIRWHGKAIRKISRMI